MNRSSAWWVPVVFVLLWATGFVVAKYGLPYAPPLSFLSWRFFFACLVLGLFIVVLRAQWPSRVHSAHLVVSGLLIHAGYLGGVWCAIKLGMPAGMAALIVNLQPVLTAFASRTVGERVTSLQWLGLALGFGGVALVVVHKITTLLMPWATVWLAVMALFSITAGTLYQKRFVPGFDLRTGTWIQYAASLALFLPLAWWLEDEPVIWNLHFVAALAWSVCALSIGAIFLMFTLIKRGAATKVTSLMYLVPPVTAVMAWILFAEPFGWLAVAGLIVSAIGVALATRS